MSASSAFSGRRQLLRRPKICETPPDPEPPGPVGCACEAVPAESSMLNTDTKTLYLHACCSHLPPDQSVDLESITDLGDSSVEVQPANCGAPGEILFDPQENVGDAHIVATATFSDTGECEAEFLVHVTDEEEEEDPEDPEDEE